MPLVSLQAARPHLHAAARTRLAGVLLLMLSACGRGAAPAPADEPAYRMEGSSVVVPPHSPLRGKLVIAPATSLGLTDSMAAPAMIEADPARQARMLAPVAGRVERLAVRLGDSVRPGQLLATLGSPDLSQAIADDARARSQLGLAKAAHDRSVGLKGIGAAADKDVAQAQADLIAAQAEAARAGARLRQMGAGRSGTLALVAPFAGVITDLAAAPGAFWTDTTAPLMTVSGLGTVFVTANVAEGDLAGVHRGQPVTIHFAAWSDEQVRGTVDSIGALLDPDTRRAKVRIALANPDGRYKPGMFATVTFTAPSRVAPTVPTTALVLKDDATIVYVEQRPWVFVARVVETGVEQGGRTVVTRGIAAGDRVIARGGVLLDD